MNTALQEQDVDVHIVAKRTKQILGDICDMTLWRLVNDPDNGFPDPIKINGRRYWNLNEIREWLASKRKAA